VLTPNPSLPKKFFINIPINSDSEYTITTTSLPAIADCSAESEAILCKSCCPSGGKVFVSSPGEGEMIAQNQTKVKLITAFTHGHRLLKHMDSYKIGFDGTETPISSCHNCGAGHGDHGDMPVSDNAFKILPTPIELNAGEGLKLKCKYEREHGHIENIVGGFRADKEMCLVFYYYAYVNDMPSLVSSSSTPTCVDTSRTKVTLTRTTL
jgi:hypothetical protein